MHPNVRAAALAGALFLAVVSYYVNVWIASILLALVMAVGYYESLKLHPNRNCPACRGTGKHRGWLWFYSHRQCTRCVGTGRQVRLGYRTFFQDGKKAHQTEVTARKKAEKALRTRS
jgi:hypothetical protein